MSSDWAPAVVFSIFALSLAATFVLRGPVGKALAQWIGGWNNTEAKWIEAKAAGRGAPAAEVEQLRAEVDELHRQLAEVHERLDFAERLLTRQREADRIAPPR